MRQLKDIGKDRGWGLTFLMVLGILGSAAYIVIIFIDFLFNDGFYSQLPFLEALLLLLQSFLSLVFLIAAWRWKRWGCFGLIALIILSLPVTIINGPQSSMLIGGAVMIALLLAVYKSKQQYFEGYSDKPV